MGVDNLLSRKKAWLPRQLFCPTCIHKPETESLISYISSFNVSPLHPFFLVLQLTLISKLLTLLRLTVHSIETLSPFYDRLPTGHQRKTISISRKSSAYYRGYFKALCASIYHEVRWKKAVLKTVERSRDTGEKDIYIKQCFLCIP